MKRTLRRAGQQQKRKYPQSPIISTNDPQTREQFYQEADADAPLVPRQTAAGVIRHPESGYYQVWLSTNGLDVISLCARRMRADAEKDLQAVKAVLGSQDFYDESKVAALLQQLRAESDETPRPLPNNLVRQICREIMRTIAHQPPSS